MGWQGFRWAAIGVATAIVTFLGWLLLGAGGPRTVQVVSIVGQLLAPLLASAVCVMRARRVGDSRRAWLLLGASAGSWGAGQAVWCYYELLARVQIPFPSLADVGHLGAVPLAAAAMLAFPSASARVTSRLRTLFDGMIVGVSLLLVSWRLVLGPVFVDSEAGTLAAIIGLAYPVGDVIVATAAVTLLGSGSKRGVAPIPLLAAALLCLAIADSAFAYFTQQGSYVSGFPTDTGWFAGYLLIALAALQPAPADDQLQVIARGWDRGRPFLPYIPVSVAIVFALVDRERIDEFQFWNGVVLFGLVISRQLLTLLENSVLIRDLERTARELRASEAELEHRAFHDPLTNLANRALFRDRLEHALAFRVNGRQRVAALFLDLDDFKTVNDTLGHEVGDQLLTAVAERLRACVRPADTIARLGGDEFAVLMEDADVEQGEGVAQRICEALTVPFNLSGRELTVCGSLGLAFADGGVGPADADALLRQADVAMYAAKMSGKGRYLTFEAGMELIVVGQFELRNDLPRALAAGELTVHYQPIVDLRTGALSAFEALVRWQHPQRGLLLPADFLTVAEETGSMGALSRQVLGEACAQVYRWQRSMPGCGDVSLHVNVSAQQLADDELPIDVAAALERSGLPVSRLVLEISERALTTDIADRLDGLKDLGVRLAVDDFGTGSSSLGYLRRFPLDILKVDRSFVAAVTEDSADEVLAGAVLQVGRSLRLVTVAEGVETSEQADLMRGLHCDQAQGYLFARPMPAADVPAFLAGQPTAATAQPG